MVSALARTWWLMALRGLLALVLGIVMLILPAVITFTLLVVVFGAYASVDGIFAITAALLNSARQSHKWVLFIEGIVGILIGFAVFSWPGISAVILLYAIAIWALATGLLEILFAARLWRQLAGKWLLLFSGIASVFLGILILVRPGIGTGVIIYFIAAYLIVFGVMLLVLGFWLKDGGEQTSATSL